MEEFMINLRKITEENFIDAFNLKLGNGQEKYVSNPIRSLAKPMFTVNSVSLLEYMMKTKWLVTLWSYMITIFQNMIFGI